MTTIDSTYKALSDPTRRAIIAQLQAGEARVMEIANPLEMSLNGVSKHIKVLEGAGLVRREIRGREHYLSIDLRPLDEASDWIDRQRRFWKQRLVKLDEILSQDSEGITPGAPPDQGKEKP